MQLLPVSDAVMKATTRHDSTDRPPIPKRKTLSTPLDNNDGGPSKKKNMVTNKEKGKNTAMEL